jgi:hypothetical protein
MKVGIMWSSDLAFDYSSRAIKDLNSAVGHNTGNVAFVHAIRKIVGDVVTTVDWSSSRISEVDVLVFPAANQIGSHTELSDLADNLLTRGVPVVAIGLGAQSSSFEENVQVTEGTKQFLNALVELAPTSSSNIWARGPYSVEQIKNNCVRADPITGCCPSLFINSNSNLGEILASKSKLFRRIAVAGGNPGFQKMRDLERDLVRLVDSASNPGCYIPQSMVDLISLGIDSRKAMDSSVISRYRNFLLPGLSESEFHAWASSFMRSFFDARSWMLELSRYDVVAGARYHGVALGLQAEIPGVIFGFDTRTRELASTSGIPVALPDEYDYLSHRTIEDIWSRFDSSLYDQNRIKMAQKLSSFLVSNGLRPSAHLKLLTDS